MLDEVKIRAYTALLTAATRIQDIVDRDLRARAGITHAQFEILVHLGQARDGLRMNELADGLIISRSGTTYRVQQLEVKTLVRRGPDASDDRGVIAHITESGAALLATAIPEHEALVQEVFFGALTRRQLSEMDSALQTALAQMAAHVGNEATLGVGARSLGV
jgi:DNA-binding MarR family transcriptional regulator